MLNSDRLPVYHGVGDSADELLCRVMAAALTSYTELAADIAAGKVDDDYETWVDFDSAESFSVSMITPENLAASGLPAGYLGLLVLWYDAAPICSVDVLDDAQDLIVLATGRMVRLVEEDVCGPFWWVEPIDGPTGTPVEPPLRSRGRRVRR